MSSVCWPRYRGVRTQREKTTVRINSATAKVLGVAMAAIWPAVGIIATAYPATVALHHAGFMNNHVVARLGILVGSTAAGRQITTSIGACCRTAAQKAAPTKRAVTVQR